MITMPFRKKPQTSFTSSSRGAHLPRGHDTMHLLNFFIPRKSRFRWGRSVLTLVGVAVVIVTFNHLAIRNSDTVSTSTRTLDEQQKQQQSQGSNVTLPTPADTERTKLGSYFWRLFRRPAKPPKPIDNWAAKKDPHDFKYIHNPEHICNDINNKTTSDIMLVIFVNSAPNNTKKRAYVRKTFGNASAWPTTGDGVSAMRMVFLIAATEDQKVQDEIHFESLLYNDIVQESFTDAYLNMTRKTVMGMKWVSTYCRKAKYTMKVDDDILLNIRRVLEIIRLAPATNFSYGTVHWAKPVRTTKGTLRKFYTPHRLFPGKQYPPYPNGHAYLMSTDVVEKIYHVATEIDLFPWSDVFVGMCLDKLGIRIRHSALFCSYGFKKANTTPVKKSNVLETKENYVDIMREYVTIYHQTEKVMDQIWAIWMKSL